MSTRMVLVTMLLACLLLLTGFFAYIGFFGEVWPSYGKPEQKVVVGQEYTDESVQVRIAKAEGRYVVALSVLDDDLIVSYVDGQVKSTVTQLGTIFDEQSTENLPSVKIMVHRKGLIKKYLTELHFAAESGEIHEYPSLKEARDALNGAEV